MKYQGVASQYYYNHPEVQLANASYDHNSYFASSMSSHVGVATTRRQSISDKIMWQKFSLPLMPILFVTKIVFITIMLFISHKILIHHRKHL